jgi:deoxycytidylate deaminase
MNGRPTWDAVWMRMADELGKRSRCFRGDIGCVLVSVDNQVVAATYVGPPPTFEPADDTKRYEEARASLPSLNLKQVFPASEPMSMTDCRAWCPRAQPDHVPEEGYVDCVSSHAEMNAVSRADWSRLQGGTAYVNGAVCFQCAKLLAACGVSRVVMKVLESDSHRRPQRSIDYLKECGISVSVI